MKLLANLVQQYQVDGLMQEQPLKVCVVHPSIEPEA